MKFYRIFFILLFFLNCAKNDSSYCHNKNDCDLLELCDEELHQCVECLKDENCKNQEFCIRGQCKSEIQKINYCGGSSSLSGGFGKNCQNYSVNNNKNIDGPICLSNGRCGCNQDNDCGINENGLVKTCIKNTCK